MHAKTGNYDKAITDYSEAIRLNPEFRRWDYNRGMCYSLKGDHDKAIADCTEAIRLDPKDAQATTAVASPIKARVK